MAEKQKKSGGGRKLERNKDKCKSYRSSKTREKNKLKRILHSNGLAEAEKYAEEKELLGYLRSIK